jgi:hypothetical protein
MIALTLRTSTSRHATARAVLEYRQSHIQPRASCLGARNTYRGLRIFGDPPTPNALSALSQPHYDIRTERTLVMRIIEWFDMVVWVTEQWKNLRILFSCAGS